MADRPFDFSWSRMSAEQRRDIMGKVIKYLLPRKHWDYSGTVTLRTRGPNTLDSHKHVLPIINAFCSQTAADMLATTLECEFWRWVVDCNGGMPSTHCKIKLRKKRVSRLAKFFRKWPNGLPSKDARKGFVLFAGSIKTQFLSR